MISGVATSIERPEHGASYVDVRPRLNLFTQLYSRNALMQMCYEHYPLGFDFFRRYTFYMFDHCTKLVFFHFTNNTKVVRFNRLQK